MSGNVAARIVALVTIAILLAALRQPGGLGAWFRAKFANAEA